MSELSQKLFAEACEVIPGGVNSPVRSWRAVGGVPAFIRRGRGSRIVDVDGREYTDLVCSWGPLVLGHAPRAVVRALADAAARGTSFGAPTPGEVELARMVVEAVPSVELVRLVSSGTEAAMSALRLARGVTGRARIVKFAGCYHGHSDSLLVRAGSGMATLGLPDSAGVPREIARLTTVVPYNDLAAAREALAAGAGEVAAVIVEPVAGNMGVVPPAPGFLEGLREITDKAGALLVFDEVITGFRVAWGGAQALYGIRPDLTCLGKILGGGLPLAAFGGRRELLERVAPLGPVYQAGTLSGNPLAVAAGLATLKELASPRTYERLDELGGLLEQGLNRALRDTGTRGCVNRVGSMLTLFLGVERVADYADAQRADTRMYAALFHALLERGVYFPPSQFEAAFVSLAHEEAELEAVGKAVGEALRSLG